MKDRDFHKNVLLPEDISIKVWKQLKADTKFLERSQVMDYSLMLGIYNVGLDSSHIYSSDWVFAPLYGMFFVLLCLMNKTRHVACLREIKFKDSVHTNRNQGYQAPKLQTASRLKLDVKSLTPQPIKTISVTQSGMSADGLHPALAPMLKSSDLKLKDLGTPLTRLPSDDLEDEQTFRQVKTAGVQFFLCFLTCLCSFFSLNFDNIFCTCTLVLPLSNNWTAKGKDTKKRADALLQGNEDMRIVQDHKSTMKAELIEGPGFYCIGIIDILQDWNNFKRFERFYKVYLCCDDGEGLSCMEPTMYRRRFLAKMLEVGFGPKKRKHDDSKNDIHTQSLPQSPNEKNSNNGKDNSDAGNEAEHNDTD
ncbi:G-protein-coupled receptor family protein [Reticulomyxa filosa]|uniref:G-protein-coupled receptor family protein n=1 Tax=Reticulomyxa filosa TaxID=46433 RepID=X6NEL4_RETFI|nr:G-protein-coupled receptor family protein [Reticulomyxa filosa]|eukprot:ETO24338.1 G-protein-coupled receptor family protein [Reticulomyxa filosa]